jgi:hypothetical protein
MVRVTAECHSECVLAMASRPASPLLQMLRAEVLRKAAPFAAPRGGLRFWG